MVYFCFNLQVNLLCASDKKKTKKTKNKKNKKNLRLGKVLKAEIIFHITIITFAIL